MKSTSTWWKILLSGLLLAGTLVANADTYQPSYSTAGFYQLSNTGRTVYNMNPAWRFYKGNIEGAEQPRLRLEHRIITRWHRISPHRGKRMHQLSG